MSTYTPGPLQASIEKHEGGKWTLILERELRQEPAKVWAALTDPAQLREWAPFETDAPMAAEGTVNLTWSGTQQQVATRITRAEAPRVLEYGDMRWELEPNGAGTRLKLWHSIDRRYIAMGTAGWHVSLDVLDGMLGGAPVNRGEAMKSGWQKLFAEYSAKFGIEMPKWGGAK